MPSRQPRERLADYSCEIALQQLERLDPDVARQIVEVDPRLRTLLEVTVTALIQILDRVDAQTEDMEPDNDPEPNCDDEDGGDHEGIDEREPNVVEAASRYYLSKV